MFSKHKTILLTLIGLVILFFGYWYFFLSKKGETATVNGVPGSGLVRANPGAVGTSSAGLEIDKKFVNGILTLNAIKMDTSVFATPEYKALNFPDQPFPVDYNIPVGRLNPFLPIGINGRTGVVPTNVQQDKPATTTATSTPSGATSTRANPNPQRVNR